MSSSTVEARRSVSLSSDAALTQATPGWLGNAAARLRYVVVPLVLLLCGGLVIYPMIFVVAESFNVGEAGVFPPPAIGLDNYADLIDDWHIIANTVFVAVHGDGDGDRDRLHARLDPDAHQRAGPQALERLMELPYYMTPLVGALAWAILAGAARAASSTSSGKASAAAAISSTSIRRSASPGSWRCSRAPSPSS